MRGDVDDGDEPADPYEELAAIDEWAGLASHVVQAFYGPGSDSKFDDFMQWLGRDKLAGWSKTAVEKLRKIADALKHKLRIVAKQLGSISYSVGVGFPRGVSIGISWTPS